MVSYLRTIQLTRLLLVLGIFSTACQVSKPKSSPVLQETEDPVNYSLCIIASAREVQLENIETASREVIIQKRQEQLQQIENAVINQGIQHQVRFCPGINTLMYFTTTPSLLEHYLRSLPQIKNTRINDDKNPDQPVPRAQ